MRPSVLEEGDETVAASAPTGRRTTPNPLGLSSDAVAFGVDDPSHVVARGPCGEARRGERTRRLPPWVEQLLDVEDGEPVAAKQLESASSEKYEKCS